VEIRVDSALATQRPSLVDLPHPSLADEGGDVVMGEAATDAKRHWGSLDGVDELGRIIWRGTAENAGQTQSACSDRTQATVWQPLL
jgi:hypothetical protein